MNTAESHRPHGTATIWNWRTALSPRLRRNVTATAVVAGAVVLASSIAAALSPARFIIVLTFLMAGICVFWWLEHRRFVNTSVALTADGRLHVTDGRTTASIHPAGVDTVAVELRTQPGISLTAATPKWTIELAGPHSVLVHPIAHAGGLFNPEATDIAQLEQSLLSIVQQATGHAARSVTPTGTTGTTSTANTAPPVADPFEWRPVVSAHGERNRRWFRIGYLALAVGIATFGVATAWGDWVGVALSAITVPGMVVAVCGSLDWAMGRARRFRLVVHDGVLRVLVGDATKRQVPIRGATVNLDRSSQYVATGTTGGASTTRTTRWVLEVTAADGSTLHQVMPALGTATVEPDYVQLRRELQQRV